MPEIKIRVQAILFNREGKLLLAQHQKGSLSYRVLPGGGLEYGEKMEEALIRELKEELGFETTAVKALVFLDEFIPPDGSRHVVLAGFHTQVEAAELQNVQVKATGEAIQRADFYSAAEILESSELFYPSKETLLQVFEIFENE